jgi:hypothetical protein
MINSIVVILKLINLYVIPYLFKLNHNTRALLMRSKSDINKIKAKLNV